MKESIRETKTDTLWQKTQHKNLIRYRSSGTYYARVRIKGKLKVRSLETDRLGVAVLRLADFHKEELEKASRLNGSKSEKLTFGDVLKLYRENGFRPLIPKQKKDLIQLKPKALDYYTERAKALPLFWPYPNLDKIPINAITPEDLIQWSKSFREERSATAHNHTLGMLRNIFDVAVERGVIYHNPARRIMRATEKPKKIILPTREQFEAFVLAVERTGSGRSGHCANLVHFLAYGGFRIGEVKHITWADCDFTKGQIRVIGAPDTGTKGTDEGIRFVPIITPMRELLERLRKERKDEPLNTPVMCVFECQKAMDRAAAVVGMKRITHHDLRHLFATRCIESGVSIPVVSKWLGHKDGGALCMRVYGHIVDEHSRKEAKKVSFSSEEESV